MVLRLNAGSSLLIGMAMALAPQALASLCLAGPVQLLGIDGAGWIRLVGLALFPFAAMVFWISGRAESQAGLVRAELGRASCRERVCPYVWISVVAVSLNKKKQ